MSLIFCSLAFPGRPLGRTLLLVASLREFGGILANSPVWLFYPSSYGEFSEEESTVFAELGVDLFPFEMNSQILKFPFGTKVQAAAVAEKAAAAKGKQLVWLDEDTLILSPPEEFIIPQTKSFAYRPVHHKLLGTSWGEEIDDFWQLIYQHCGASPEKGFQMVTHTGEKIRPYFNAGSYSICPERGILAAWSRNFQSSYQVPAFQTFYEQDVLYAIFMHQAILTGTIMAELDQTELQELSLSINYPLHLHGEIPEDLQARSIDELVTVRSEKLFDQPGWQEELPISGELAAWITTRLDQYRQQGDHA